MKAEKKDNIVLLYDGDCPFCDHYVNLIKIRETFGPVKIINGRRDSHYVSVVKERKYNLNEGMCLIINNEIYFGSDCIHLLALLSSRSDIFNKLNAILFSSRFFAKILYPILKLGRRMSLLVLGIKKIP